MDYAKYLDKNRKSCRELFNIPTSKEQEEYIYLNGNSLGLQPKTINSSINSNIKLWEMKNIEKENIGYSSIQKQRNIDEIKSIDMLSKLTGANKDELAIMNGLSTNLHMLLCSFYKPNKRRYKILTEYNAFNSDQYIVQTQLLHNNISIDNGLLIVGNKDNYIISTQDICSVIQENSDSIAVLLIGAVNYITGQFFNIKKITEFAHRYNIIVGFDLAHAIGNVPLELHEWNVDFAAWCSYKYLNAGAGAIGGIFIHQNHFPKSGKNNNILGGWWGQKLESRIAFLSESSFDPIPNANGWQTSNPSSILLSMLSESLKIFDTAGGINILREQSTFLCNFLEKRLVGELGDNIKIITPSIPYRGSQISFYLTNAIDSKIIYNYLLDNLVVCDLRSNIFRIAVAPLYNTFVEVEKFVQILKKSIDEYKSKEI